MSVSALGYIGLEVSDLAAWDAYATGMLGLMPVDADGAARRFRLDSHAWRIALEEGPADDLAYVGYELDGPADLAALAAKLSAAGVAVEEPDADLVKSRGVADLVATHDPSGLRVELYYGPTMRFEAPFVSPAGVPSFVTGEQGLGHVVLAAPDIASMRRFYCDLLGFRLSDTIRLELGPDFAIELEFFHCNARHHTLALVPAPLPKKLNHFMLQVQSLDQVGFAMQRMERAGAKIAQSLGRHSNDHMVSFYALTPSSFEVEYGFGAIEVDEARWRVARHDVTSIWGHKRVAG
jgi:2,3-dihydroxybiphenyl 1,2-dioxygenase